jgi:hypothetical protein
MKRHALFSLMTLFLLAPTARATTLVRLSLEQLSQAATVVVRGRIVAQQSGWNQAHTQILTQTTVEVIESVKGVPPSPLVMEQVGGTVGNVHVRVAGTVFFHPQEDFYLFLEPARGESRCFLLVGMLQGAYRIVRDPKSGREHVVNPLSGFDLSPRRLVDEASRAAVVPMPMFRQKLENALAAPLRIPRGTRLPVRVNKPPIRRSGVWHLCAETTADIFPNSRVVVPVGSAVEGTAEMVAGRWRICWRELSVRGTPIALHATNDAPAMELLRGREMFVVLR